MGVPTRGCSDPSCGEAVFLLAAARRLAANGADPSTTMELLHGVDLHDASLGHSRRLLNAEGFDATLHVGDFFAQPTLAQLGGQLPWMDAVVGNSPFVRYHEHKVLSPRPRGSGSGFRATT